MTTHAYNEAYLPYAMENLASMMDCGINQCGFSPQLFYRMFLTSGVASQIEKGNPRYVVGLAGAELACHIIERTTGESPRVINGAFSISSEYWAGWVLAYYQWESGYTFRFIHDNGLNIEKVIAMYHPLHEADLDKFATIAEKIIAENVKTSISPLKKAREQHGLSQVELSRISGISLRMIRAYEQKSQDFAKANFRTVSKLESVLHADFSEI
ncbi:MAG: helix-turn-helix transcriptional regulator [Alistipes sp.]|nr:helix-turn-helix transcriptional regulator [Candidatus Alistipes equi]